MTMVGLLSWNTIDCMCSLPLIDSPKKEGIIDSSPCSSNLWEDATQGCALATSCIISLNQDWWKLPCIDDLNKRWPLYTLPEILQLVNEKHNGCTMQHLMTMYYWKLSSHALITSKIMLKLITGLTSQESHHIYSRNVTKVFTITGDTLYNDSKKLQESLSCLSHLIKIWFLVEMLLYIWLCGM